MCIEEQNDMATMGAHLFAVVAVGVAFHIMAAVEVISTTIRLDSSNCVAKYCKYGTTGYVDTFFRKFSIFGKIRPRRFSWSLITNMALVFKNFQP